MVRPQQPALEQGSHPMHPWQQFNCGTQILAFKFADLMVIAQLFDSLIRFPTVRMDTTALHNGSLDELAQVYGRAVGYPCHTDAPDADPIFLRRNHYQCLDWNSSSFASRHYSSDLGFVHFNPATEFVPARANHGSAQFMHKRPGALIAAQAQNSLQSQCADSVFLACHLPDRPKPNAQRQTAVLEDGSGGRCCLMATTRANQPASLRSPRFVAATAWAHKSFRPAQRHQIFAALLLAMKILLHFQKRLRIVLDHSFPLQLGVTGVNRIPRKPGFGRIRPDRGWSYREGWGDGLR